MPRKFLSLDKTHNPDPANGPFYTVSYRRPIDPIELNRRRYRSRQFSLYMEEINHNALTKYLYEKEFDQLLHGRRLAKSREWANSSFEQIMRHIRSNWNNSGEPTIIGNGGVAGLDQDENYVSRMSFRQQLNQSRRVRAPKPDKIEQSAEEGAFEVRKFDQEFIDRVKQARASQGLTQEQLAKLINRHATEIAHFERGDLPYEGALKDVLHNKLGLSHD